MTKKLLITLAISIFLMFSTIPLGAYLGGYGGHHIKFFVSLLLYASAAFYFSHISQSSKERWLRNLLLISPPVLIFGYTYILSALQHSFLETQISWPSTMAYLLGFGAGVAIYKVSKPMKFVLSASVIFFGLWVMVSGYSYWLNYLNTGTYNGKVNEPIAYFSLTDGYGNTFTNKDFEGKLVIFDFWISSCGYCFMEMPEYEKLFVKYRNHKDILLYSVNHPLHSDTAGLANYLIRDLNLTFPILYASNSVVKQFYVDYYPKYIAVEDGKTIVYRGNLQGLKRMLENIE